MKYVSDIATGLDSQFLREAMTGRFIVVRRPVQDAAWRHVCIDRLDLLPQLDLRRQPEIIQPVFQPRAQPRSGGGDCGQDRLHALFHRGHVKDQHQDRRQRAESR